VSRAQLGAINIAAIVDIINVRMPRFWRGPTTSCRSSAEPAGAPCGVGRKVDDVAADLTDFGIGPQFGDEGVGLQQPAKVWEDHGDGLPSVHADANVEHLDRDDVPGSAPLTAMGPETGLRPGTT
jgi:hypothetical protein